LASLSDRLNASGFQASETPLQTNENISAAAGGDNYYEGSPTNAFVKMDDGGREDPSLSAQESLIDPNSLVTDVAGLVVGGDTRVDHLYNDIRKSNEGTL